MVGSWVERHCLVVGCSELPGGMLLVWPSIILAGRLCGVIVGSYAVFALSLRVAEICLH